MKFFLINISILFCGLRLLAQTPENIILNNIDNGGKVYRASNHIQLKPGYSFKSSINDRMRAYIDTDFIQTNYVYQNKLTSNEINDKKIETSNMIGAIEGSFNVNLIGSANYTVGIDIPSGINNLQPNLTLSYNSFGTEGLLGTGWDLGGISMITRTGQNLFYDNNITPVKTNYEDRFMWDGQRLLIKSGDYGKDGSEYATANESFAEIISYGKSGDGPERFEILTKEGLRMHYGLITEESIEPDSRFLADDNKTVLTWYLKKVTDLQGNYFEYNYRTFNDGKEIRLTEIKYTGNRVTKLKPKNKIKFNYIEKDDVNTYYIAGKLVSSSILLKNIEIFVQNELLSTYNFNYSNNTYNTFLNEIEKTNFNGEKLNSTVFKYKENDFDEATYNNIDRGEINNIDRLKHRFFNGDFNGDGLVDILAVELQSLPAGFVRYVNFKIFINKNSRFILTQTISTCNNIPHYFIYPYHCAFVTNSGNIDSQIPINAVDIKIIDINGDSFDDILIGSHNTIPEEVENHFYRYGVLFITANNNEITSTWSNDYLELKRYQKKVSPWWHLNPKYEYVNFAVNLGDFDGDGISELIAIESNTDNIHFKSFDGRVNYKYNVNNNHSNNDKYVLNPEILIMDYNGDGISDIIYKNLTNAVNYDKYIELNINNNQVNIISEGVFSVSSLDYFRGNINSNYNNRHVIDFNGDGLSDLIQINKDQFNIEYVELWLSMGNKQNIHNKIFIPLSFEKTRINLPVNVISDQKKVLFRDVNGDGKTEIIRVFNDFIRVYTYNCKTKNFDFITVPLKNQNNVNILPIYNNDSYFTLDDFTGDGNLELTGFNFKYTHLDFIELNLPFSKQTKYLETIKDGLENVINIEYSTLAKQENYEITLNLNIPPIRVLNQAIPIVKSVEYIDKFNRKIEEKYKFKNFLVHLGGKGFIGALENESYNITFETYNKNISELKNHFTIVPKISESGLFKNNTYQKITETISENAVVTRGKRVYIEPVKTTTINFLENSRAETDYIFDDFNNLTQSIENINQGQQITRSTFQYEQISSWVPSNLTIQNTSITYNGDVFNEGAKLEYYTDGISKGLIKNKILNPNKSYSITSEYTYDEFGNPLTEKITPLGFPSKTKSFEIADNGINVLKITDELGRKKEMQYHKKFDLPIQITDDRGNIEKLEYDDWGRLIKTTDIFGNTANIQYIWDIGSGMDITNPVLASSKLYKVQTTSQGKPSTSTWYDNHGREISTMVQSPAGDIYKSISFDLKGNKHKETNNYGPTTPLITSYEYDDFGRIKKVNNPKGTSDFDYATNVLGMKTTVTNPNGSKVTEITDATGKKVEVENIGNSPQESNKLRYEYYANGQAKNIYLNNKLVTNMEYDQAGNQTLLNDVNSGATVYKYNIIGGLTDQIDANGKHYIIKYDDLGREEKTEGPDGITNFEYYAENQNGRFKIKQITSPNGAIHKFEYDKYDRITKRTEIFEDYEVSEQFQYNSQNQLTRKTYSTGIAINYVYDNLGALEKIINVQTGDVLFKRDEVNNLGQVTKFTLGNGLTSHRIYDIYGMPKEFKTEGVEHYLYNFEKETGNLKMRSNLLGNETVETFEYDALDRLEVIKGYNQQEKLRMQYAANGNINNKSDIGAYQYHPEKLNAVEKVVSNTNKISLHTQDITYTSFNSPETIKENNFELKIEYGVNQHRVKSELKKDEQTICTKFFTSLGVEKIIENNQSTEITYIPLGNVVALYVNQNGTKNLYYVYTDHLGSFNTVTNADGIIVYEQSFDAWGRKRNPQNWNDNENIPETPTWLRGYTGHEHLPEFDLINMNGRVYDPLLGRMLSPDNFIQSPGFSQSYNRYAYVWNNPLKYSDPSGEAVHFLIPVVIGAVVGGTVGGVVAHENGQNWWKGAITGAIIGAGVGLGVSSGMALANPKLISGASKTGINGIFGTKVATNATWNITYNSLLTANVNIASSFAQGRGLDGAYASGLVGLVAGGIGGALINSPARYRNMLSETFTKQNMLTAGLNGFGDRLVYSRQLGQSWSNSIINGIYGGIEGLMSAHMANDKLIIGGFGTGSETIGRYASSFLSQGITSVPGLGYTLFNFYAPLRSYNTIVSNYPESKRLIGGTALLFHQFLNDPHFNAQFGDPAVWSLGLVNYSNYPYYINPFGKQHIEEFFNN